MLDEDLHDAVLDLVKQSNPSKAAIVRAFFAT